MHRRSLPVVACPLVEQVVADGGHCRQCEKRVHDLSAMTQRQARRFLHRNRDRSICVAYRVAPDGRVRFRPADAARRLHGWSLPLLLGALGGCASLGRDLEVPDDVTCLQYRGQRIDCDEAAYVGFAWQPDASDEVAPSHDPVLSKEIVPPGEDHGSDDPPSSSMGDAPDLDPEPEDVDADSDETRHEVGWVDDDIFMGGVRVPTRERRAERWTRKQRRKARRAERRAARGS